MNGLTDKIDRHVGQMAPHVRDREAAILLESASKAIKASEKTVSICNEHFNRGITCHLCPLYKTCHTLNDYEKKADWIIKMDIAATSK